ncbi:unnamed protein product [Parascedosporium putredinis]|uniref:Ankyrin n=1 Tax=Parascedosporium putredinis TaxID=1442378 RepID=A0A9P1MAC0_9PEZI|nr:unnamed protein product [Parascedosporium putredinis]CAI7996333.1 unnamed protein product [Parascedosporium putredinis]
MDCVALLVEIGGADVNARDNKGRTRLFSAVNWNDEEMFCKLLGYGISCNAQDTKGNTALHQPLSHMSMAVITHLLQAGADPNLQNHVGLTPLMISAQTTTHVERLLAAGADIEAVDKSGASVLFRLFHGYFDKDASTFSEIRLLLDRGASPTRRDYKGRTILHNAVKGYKPRIPVHTATWQPSTDGGVTKRRSRKPGLTNIDTRDKYGATPLHLAAVYSPQLTLKLLRAGADPTVATFEGLTPLHLAARSRQSNIVGMLLDDLRRRQNACKGPDGAQEPLHDGTAAEKPREPVPGVDAIAVSDEKIITPLYYACRSGRPETVSLLLEAGADISLTNVFEAYSEDVHATAVRIDDTMRPARRENAQPGVLRPHETARLDEILDMLLARGAAFHGYTVARVDPPIWPSYLYSIQDSEYMVRSMSVAWRKWEEENGVANDVSSTARSVHERATPLLDQAWMQSLKEHESAITRDSENRDLFHRFMVQRQYHLVEAMARVGSSFLPTAAGPWSKCNFSSLVSGGFTSLVDKVGTLELERKLPEGLWHAYGDETKPGLWRFRRDFRPETPSTHHSLPESPGSHNSNLGEEDLGVDDLGQTHARREFWPHRPYLIAAVSRELPNMGVVRLLVEKFGVHIDETHSEYSFKPPGWRYEEEIHFALRTAASGANWWQVHQALPYLIQAGADVNLMPLRGDSPLCWAIADRMRVPRPFALAASRMLIAAGADVNAHNYGGFSCLATASISNNGELVEFFLAQGAVVTGDAVEGALRNRNPHILEPLLSAGPFDFASGLRPRFGQAYKAFPCFRDSEVDWRCKDMEEGHYPVIYLAPDEYPLLHHMLYERLAADALLEMADLKVNERDPEGRTMLHAACYSDRGLGRLLRINKESAAGDVQEDDNGLNILHHTVQKDQYYWGYHSDDSSEMKRDKFAQTINIILERQPDLANDADNRGFTPLLLAAELPVLDERVRAIRILLSHGADPQRTANSGDTILHLLASKHEFSEPSLGCLFQELVNTWGVDVNARNACGWTPLSVYCSQPGAPGANDPSRVKRKEEEALRLMVELGADLSVRDNSGRGLLHLAARGGPFRFKKLMDLGLDPSLEDDAQQTPIDRAAACGQTAILELFERKD